VNNGWGAYECCYARTLLACLVGALEVPGGLLGTTVLLSKPGLDHDRWATVEPGPDGFLSYPFHPTDKANWIAKPTVRHAYSTLIPGTGDGPYAQAVGSTSLTWLRLQGRAAPNWPVPKPPEVWFVYRCNPLISFSETTRLGETIAGFPFMVAFAYTHDETNHFADILLPDATDLEGLQLWRVGGTKYQESFWDHQGFALRQPVVAPLGEARDFTEVSTELAHRVGIAGKYYAAVNKGAGGIALKHEFGDFSLDTSGEQRYTRDEIWDHICRSASAEVSEGAHAHGLDWWKEHGLATKPYPQSEWYLLPTMEKRGLRFELPYQERLLRIGGELARRLHENDMHWWDTQLKEYQALPAWKDFPGLYENEVGTLGGKLGEFPFWLITSRSMQYAWGANAGIQLMREVSENISGHRGVIMNTGTAERMGIAEGDHVEISTPARKVSANAVLRQGIRPDTLLLIGQFDHWVTPMAKGFGKDGSASMNSLAVMSMELTDATGSGADLVRVKLARTGAGVPA